MPVQIYRSENNNDLGTALLGGIEAFMKGRKYRQEMQDSQLARALTNKKLQQADYETEKMRTESLLNQAKYDRISSGASSLMPSGLVADKWDEYGLPSGYINPRQEVLQKQVEEYYKPLSGESARSFAQAEQGLGNVATLKKSLGYDNQGNLMPDSGYTRKLVRSKLAQNKPWLTSGTGIVPAVTSIAGNIIAGKEGREIALNYGNLIQNLLRLRSGAAVPIQEQIDEFTRTGYRIGDDPETTYKKLQQGYQLLNSIKTSVRPTPRFKDQAEAEAYGLSDLMPQANNDLNEENIQFTMQKYGMTRQQVLEALNAS